jgi:6-phosphogluconolactonase
LQPAKKTIEHTGSSVVEDRQDRPHVHATVFSPDNKYLFVTDLGTDKVNIYSFNAKKGELKEAEVPFEITEPGAGPRHFTFHPNGRFAYLIEELTGSISVYSYQNGRLSLLQNISALPNEYTGPIGSADIHVAPDGKFLYASNRGESNSIAAFSINNEGKLLNTGHYNVMGKKPRNFNLDPTGNYLLVANQDSDEIVVFKRNVNDGTLHDTGQRIKVPRPVCIKWIY